MRKRNIQLIIRINERERNQLKLQLKKSGLSQSLYIRKLISGVVPKEKPPADYYSMMRELHQIGNNLNQIAVKAHRLNVIDVQK